MATIMSRISKKFMETASQTKCRMSQRRRSICSEGAIAAAAASNELVVKVTSKSLIKPSSPTPPHLRNFKLSLLDKALLPTNIPLYTSFLLFYPKKNDAATAITQQLLQDSLSETLSHFYPLAGRIEAKEDGDDISVIQCTDQGAEYFEAEADQEMLHFLTSGPPDIKLLGRHLVPPLPQLLLSPERPVACVQTTVFRCGAVALGVNIDHLVADATCFQIFFNHWAAVASRGDQYDSLLTNLYAHDHAASLFPISEAVLDYKPPAVRKPVDFSQNIAMPEENTVLQRFVFKPNQVSALKSRVSSSQVPNPSRTVAIFALTWKTAMQAYMTTGLVSPFSSDALCTVDLRSRFKTLLPGYCLGNLFWLTTTAPYVVETRPTTPLTDEVLRRLAYELKRSIDRVDAEFAENLKGEKGQGEIRKWLEGMGNRGKQYVFSGAVNLGLKNVDFGWGKPIWVCFLSTPGVSIPDTVTLIEGRDDQVEAWVRLTTKEMAVFERDPQLHQYANVNPTVISRL